MTPTAPSSPSTRAPRSRLRILACALSLVGVVGGLPLAAQSASAAPERVPHTAPWNGVDVFVSGGILYGMGVRTFSHGHTFCVPLSPGWNSIPIEAPFGGRSGAELTGSKSCSDEGGLGTYSFQVKPGEHWHITNDAPRCVTYSGGPAGQCSGRRP
jgi:hypothetical protein